MEIIAEPVSVELLRKSIECVVVTAADESSTSNMLLLEVSELFSSEEVAIPTG
jgi:hypothetical protein